MITLLNTSIITSFGIYDYVPVGLNHVKELIADEGYESAIGHASTAELLSELLGVPVPVNRVNFVQRLNEQAIVLGIITLTKV